MSNKNNEPTVFHTETSYLALNFMCFMIGLGCLLGFVGSFFNLFTLRISGFLELGVAILSPIVTGYLAYRFLKPTFLLIKRLLIDPILNFFRFIKRLLSKLIR